MALSSTNQKISAVILVLAVTGLVFVIKTPLSLSQINQNTDIPTPPFEGGSDPNPTPAEIPEGPFDFTFDPGWTPPSNNYVEVDNSRRGELNAQATTQQAQELQALQAEDLQKCLTEGQSSLRGPANETLQDGVGEAITDTLEEDLPQALETEIKNNLPTDLENKVKEILPTKFNELVKDELKTTLPQALNQASNNGTVPLNSDEVGSIIKNQLDQAIGNNLNNAFKFAIEDALPQAIKGSIEKGLPSAIENIFQNNLPGRLNISIRGSFEQDFGPQVRNMLIDQLTNPGGGSSGGGGLDFITSLLPPEITGLLDLLGSLGGNNGGGGNNSSNLDPEVIDEITEAMIDEYTEIALTEITGSMDEITNQAILALEGNMDEIMGSLEGSIFNLTDQITGEMNSLLEESLSSVTDELLTGFEDITGNVVNEITDSLTGLTDGLFNELTDSLNLNGLLNETMGEFTNIFETSLSSITGPITAGLTGITSTLTDEILNPITGVMGELTDKITAPLKGLTDKILSPVTGLFDETLGKVTGALEQGVDQIVGGVLDSVDLGSLPETLVGDAVSNITQGVTDVIPGIGDLNPLAGIAGFGVYVPVRETSGPLLTTTQTIEGNTHEIDLTTKRIEQINIEICTYLKSIKRIQTAFEQKEFVEDVDLRRSANEQAEQYRAEVIDFTKKGFDSTGEGPDAPLYVENTDRYIKENVWPEAINVALDDLKKSNNIFKDETISSITNDSNQENQSTITKAQYDRFASGEITDRDEWFSTFLAISNPFAPNSPETSRRINDQILAHRQLDAEQNAREEILAGDGYLPVRECEEYTEDGSACRRWKTITPASQIKTVASEVLNYRQNLYENPDPGDVSPGGGPSLEETRTYTPSSGGGGTSNRNTSPGGIDLRQIVTALGRLFNLGSGSGGSNTTTRTQTPTLYFTHSRETSFARLTWQGTGIQSCRAGNDWISGEYDPAFIFTNISAGLPLDLKDTVRISLPINMGLRLIRDRNDTLNSFEFFEVYKTDLYTEYTISINDSLITTGDKISLQFYPFIDSSSVEIEVGAGETGIEVAQKLLDAITAIKASSEADVQNIKIILNRFDFSTLNSSLFTIKPKLTYKLECLGENNEVISKTVNLQ